MKTAEFLVIVADYYKKLSSLPVSDFRLPRQPMIRTDAIGGPQSTKVEEDMASTKSDAALLAAAKMRAVAFQFNDAKASTGLRRSLAA
jgi:hypothetical protein